MIESLFVNALIGSLSDTLARSQKLKLAALRALRTTIQGVAGAFPSAGVGTAILETGYTKTLAYSLLAAGIAGVVSFLNNVASFLPEDPTQPRASALGIE